MIKIALTGGIGTGKTFISKRFVQNGIPVFYADEEAKKLYSDEKVLASLRDIFGEEIFHDGALVFSKLASIVFNNDTDMKKLESIIHPRVMEEFLKWASQQKSEQVMMESAIIFEAHLEKYFDKVFVVNASLPVRIARIRRRNPEMSEEEIMARIEKQIPQEVKCERADLVIEHEVDI